MSMSHIAGYNPELDELERNLQAVIQPPTNQAPQNNGYESDSILSRRTASYGSESRHTESSFESRQTYSSHEMKPQKPIPPPVCIPVCIRNLNIFFS
jgi:hypothetical protein